MSLVPAAGERAPTRWRAGMFLCKAAVFQAQRTARNLLWGQPPRLRRCADHPNGAPLAESRSLLYPSRLSTEFTLQAGKVQNLRVAAAWLDGLKIPRGAVFSFWRHVPRPVRRRGFVAGRELREGCIVPSVGGGLCQLSNALYDAALLAGCEIVERHAHSRRVPGSMAEAGRDATVFWNYVDLRFRPPVDCRLEVGLTRRELVVRLRALTTAGAAHSAPTVLRSSSLAAEQAATVESCETCGVTQCFRHPEANSSRTKLGATAWLVDAWQPEFDRYLRERRQPADWLFTPLNSAFWRLGSYRWDALDWAGVRQAPWETLRRSWASRRLAAQGAARQQALSRFDEALVKRYARGLPASAPHLVVSQNLLPFLWRAGALGGRTFDVLMTRLPMSALQAALDRAAARHPQSRTLADFRAPAEYVAAEAEALAEAHRWITPHGAIARLAGSRAVKLAWQMPPAEPAIMAAARGRDALFPASTLGRKGAHELAEAARQLGLRVQLGGPVLEGADCWRGVETLPANENWAGVGVVVLPAWVEHWPRRLLRAAANGVPVIAGEACGLAEVPGVITLPEEDPAALTRHLADILGGREARPLPAETMA